MKNFKKISLIALLVAIVILSSSFLSSLFNDEKITVSKKEYEQLLRFKELNNIYNVIEKNYYVEPDYEKMMETAKRGLLSGLEDPYTFYYNPEEYAKYWEEDSGEYAGIGVQIQANLKTMECKITRVFKNSPSQEIGIKKGDILVKAGDIEVNAKNLNCWFYSW